MVNAKFLTVSYTDLQLDAGKVTNNKKSDTDFTEILNEQRDNFKTNSKDEKDSLNISEVKDSSKRDEIQKMFKEINISKKDEINPEEKTEAVFVQVIEYLQNVIQKVSEELNISPEEVIEGIKELDFKPTDLFDMKNISKLVVSLSGEKDMSSLLVNDKLSGLVKEIFAESENLRAFLKDNLGLSEDEFNKLLQKFDEAVEVEDFFVNELVETDTELGKIDNNFIKSDAELIEKDIDDEVQIDTKNVLVKDENSGLNSDFDKNNSNSNGENNSHMTYEGISMETVITKLQSVIETNSSVEKTGIRDTIINQILDGISTNVNSEMTSIELQLNPESLGKVNVTVSSKEGILTAQIVAQTEIAKEAIESQIATLKETFENQGLKVEEVEVTLASKSFDQNLSNQSSDENGNSKSRKHISQEEIDEINGLKATEEEKVVEEVLKELGTTVSYQA